MKILLHACCGPCAIYPTRVLRGEGWEVMGFFYPHNIHPYTECVRRKKALEQFAAEADLKLIIQEGYDLEGFLRKAVYRETDRCRICYHDRLYATAMTARRGKFDAFTSTLLYSRHQNHRQIQELGEAVAKETGVRFHYEDFRDGWKEGIDASREMGLYRQQYCGCIYSEKERYLGRSARNTAKGKG
jgi:hypothetical protein